MAEVALTFRVQGTPEVQRAFQQLTQGAQQVTQATERATSAASAQAVSSGRARTAVSGLAAAASAAANSAALLGGEGSKVAVVFDGVAMAASRAAGFLGTLRLGFLGLLGPIAAVIAASVALNRVTEQAQYRVGAFGEALRWLRKHLGDGVDALEVYRAKMAELRAAQETQMALAPLMLHQQREQSLSFADIATGANKAKEAIEQITARDKAAAEAAAKRAAGLADLAAAQRLATQEIWEAVRADAQLAEIEQVLVPRGLAMAQALHGVVLEARDYVIVQRELADLDFTAFLKEQVPWLVQLGKAWEGVASEAARVRGWLGQGVWQTTITPIAVTGIDTAITQLRSLVNWGEITGQTAKAMLLSWLAMAAGMGNVEWMVRIQAELEGLSGTVQTFVGTVQTGVESVFTTLEQFGIDTARSISDAFTGALVHGQNAFRALIDAMLQQVARLAANWLFMQIFGWLFPPARFIFNPFPGLIGPLPGVVIPGLQRGGDFIATRPTPLMVGETGAERVSVHPLTAGAGGAGQITLNFYGATIFDEMSLQQFVRRQLVPVISRELGRVVG